MRFLYRKKENIDTNMLLMRYILLMGFYWAANAVLGSFASIMLISKGFSSAQVGLALSAGSFAGLFLQPFFAGLADRHPEFPPQLLMLCLFLFCAAGAFLINPLAVWLSAVFFVYALTRAVNEAIQPLTNSVSIYYLNRGLPVNFGIARGSGSIFYAVSATVLGTLVSRFGADILPGTAALLYLLGAAASLLLPVISGSIADSTDEAAVTGKEAAGGSVFSFLLKRRRILPLLAGSCFLQVFHSASSSYLIYITKACGGDSAVMGYALSIAAMAELPAMFCFSMLMKRFSPAFLLKTAGVCYLLKAAALAVSGSVTGLYLTMLLQAGSYGLYIPASVYYVNRIMDDSDLFKGQAMFTAAATAGGMLGSLFGGLVLQQWGLTGLHTFDLSAAAMGAVLLLLFS